MPGRTAVRRTACPGCRAGPRTGSATRPGGLRVGREAPSVRTVLIQSARPSNQPILASSTRSTAGRGFQVEYGRLVEEVDPPPPRCGSGRRARSARARWRWDSASAAAAWRRRRRASPPRNGRTSGSHPTTRWRWATTQTCEAVRIGEGAAVRRVDLDAGAAELVGLRLQRHAERGVVGGARLRSAGRRPPHGIPPPRGRRRTGVPRGSAQTPERERALEPERVERLVERRRLEPGQDLGLALEECLRRRRRPRGGAASP